MTAEPIATVRLEQAGPYDSSPRLRLSANGAGMVLDKPTARRLHRELGHALYALDDVATRAEDVADYIPAVRALVANDAEREASPTTAEYLAATLEWIAAVSRHGHSGTVADYNAGLRDAGQIVATTRDLAAGRPSTTLAGQAIARRAAELAKGPTTAATGAITVPTGGNWPDVLAAAIREAIAGERPCVVQVSTTARKMLGERVLQRLSPGNTNVTFEVAP